MRRQLSAILLRATHPDLWGHLHSMMEHQWLGLQAAESLHEQRLEKVLRHAVEHVPYYRTLSATAGWEPAAMTHASLSDFPLVDKKILTDEQESFLAQTARPEDRIAESTGGSSGVWFGFFYDRRTKEIRRATDFFSRVMAGWRPGDPIAVVWGHRGDVAATTSWRARLANTLLHRRITLNAYDMDATALESYVVRLERHRPRIIVGYASSLAFLAEYMGRRGGHSIRPTGIISSAETLNDDQRSVIESEFGCQVFNRYGSREFANIAQQCEVGGGLHVFSDRIHVEILRSDGTPCEPGESGEIVITDLINSVMPFIRYRTGDIGALATEPCPCGRSLPLLAKVEGRVSEIIVGQNGKYYSCQSPRLFGADIPGIDQMQVIQESITSIEVRIVPNEAWSPESRRLLEERMKGLLGAVSVTVSLTDQILAAPSGKYQFTISKVSPFSPQES